MRNLTITRKKSFVGCLVKVKVYIEDAIAGTETINNVPCIRIGELKNGETKTFPIGDHATKVFVIVDKLSKDYCNDFFEIPEGTEDIFLSGENKLSPFSGNIFFYQISSEKVLENRKKGSKKGIIILIPVIIISAIIGYLISPSLSINTYSPKTFTVEGMLITLTDEFTEINMDGFTSCFNSKNIAVFTIKESFSLIDGFEDYTIEQYADIVIKNNNKDPESLKQENGLTYFEYSFLNPNDNVTYYYLTTLYKSDDAFWMVTFSCNDKQQEKYRETFIDWAKEVKFTNQSV